MPSKPLLLLISLIILTHCAPAIENEPGVSLELAEYRKEVISELSYSITLSVPEDPEEDIQGSLVAIFDLSGNNTALPMDFRENSDKVTSLSVNGNDAMIELKEDHLLLPEDLLKEGENTISIDFIAGETSLNRNPDYLYTLFVPDRARTAFPLFDQPNLKATYQLTLEIPDSWNAISNGPLVSKSESEKESRTVWEFGPSDLISSYLFSFVAGEFESVTRTVGRREMTMLHRETDEEKVERNLDEIFELHAFSLDWLEEYTGISYPFQKFDFALIPSFQYGGMEHVGAIQYRASSLFLDESPSESQLLSRASLIAHETAHMWFGDLVTMQWFNDVWTKEVFANFMAAKIMNPRFPGINHDLNFLVRHYPSAYSVDRTEGANPIRQELPNLNEAGTMYGAIIYNKAPIMMRQLELRIGEEVFRDGMQEYLNTYAFDNATWPDLVDILDAKTPADLNTWSEVWVNTPGRPHFYSSFEYANSKIVQTDPIEQGRIWPQSFEVLSSGENGTKIYPVLSDASETVFESSANQYYFVANSNGYGYGLFESKITDLEIWSELDDVARGALLINLYENLLEGDVEPAAYFAELSEIIQTEKNQLLLNLALGHMRTIYWDMLSEEQRMQRAPELESLLWEAVLKQDDPSRRKIFFNSWESVVLTDQGLDRLYRIWDEEIEVENLPLSENDYIGMAGTLAIKDPTIADGIVTTQLTRISNPDRKRRFEFISPALSPDQEVRDEFFGSLKEEENRQVESWVLGALGYLHHPLRTEQSERYIQASLELLEEIQVTGDIFFPGRWVGATLGNHSSDSAVETVRTFLSDRPDYNYQLRLKILQGADMMFRMNALKE